MSSLLSLSCSFLALDLLSAVHSYCLESRPVASILRSPYMLILIPIYVTAWRVDLNLSKDAFFLFLPQWLQLAVDTPEQFKFLSTLGNSSSKSNDNKGEFALGMCSQ